MRTPVSPIIASGSLQGLEASREGSASERMLLSLSWRIGSKGSGESRSRLDSNASPKVQPCRQDTTALPTSTAGKGSPMPGPTRAGQAVAQRSQLKKAAFKATGGSARCRPRHRAGEKNMRAPARVRPNPSFNPDPLRQAALPAQRLGIIMHRAGKAPCLRGQG